MDSQNNNLTNMIPERSRDTEQTEIIIDVYKILDIDSNSSKKKIREKFQDKIDSRQNTFRQRVLVSLAYDVFYEEKKNSYKNLGEGKYKIMKKDQFYYSLVGNVSMIIKMNFSDEQLFEQVDELDRTCLYIAARSGYFELCRYFFDRCQEKNKNEYLNRVQKNGSTALHASSFYGQKQIIKLLMAYEANLDIINQYGNSAKDECKDEEIKATFDNYSFDNISTFYNKNQDLVYQMKEYDFGFRLERKINEKGFYEVFKNEIKNYKHTFHGTRLKSAESILNTGLRTPGQKDANGATIRIPLGHIPEGIKVVGIENWAQAIFVSPSPFYAADSCYSDHFESNKKTYCVVFETFVDPNSQFQKHEATVCQRDFEKMNETINVEFRVREKDYDNQDEKTNLSINLQQSIIYRVPIIQKSKPVLTAALLFLDFNVLKQAKNSQEYIDKIKNSLNL